MTELLSDLFTAVFTAENMGLAALTAFVYGLWVADGKN
jgi:hypothetical protein